MSVSIALRRAPFAIFSKKAPSTLPAYDIDKDFTYYFFADVMSSLSGVEPSFLTAAGRYTTAPTAHTAVPQPPSHGQNTQEWLI